MRGSIRLIACCVALIGSTANASCLKELTAIKNELEPIASAMAKTTIAPNLIVTDIPTGFYGLAVTRRNILYISNKACGQKSANLHALVAHELGHFVAHVLYPKIEQDSHAKQLQIGLAVHEGLADDIGAKILLASHQPQFVDQAIAHFSWRCNSAKTEEDDQFNNMNKTDACRKASVWSFVKSSTPVPVSQW
jgi:hypothetical protein